VISISNVHDHPADRSAKQPKVRNLKPNPQPKAQKLKLATRDPRSKRR
jgi:hypothetical protein